MKRLLNHPWVWLAPALVPFVLFLVWPVLRVMALSFQQEDLVTEYWVGLKQYRMLVLDPDFWRALRHTLLFTAVVVPVWILVSLAIATAITPMRKRARDGWMTCFYLTYLVSPVVLALVWSWILFPGADGLLNHALSLIGVGPIPWLSSGHWALASVILSTALTIPGSGVIIYSAAISQLPRELDEAAQLEGAGVWARWWRIRMPLLRPTTLYLTVIYTIASFQVFERVYIMTGGGPGGATTVLVEQIYSRAFLDFDFGMASAQAVILLFLIAAVAWVQFRTLHTDIQY
jgi:multiple sugar transport system permease protein